MEDKIICIEDVIMENGVHEGKVAFTKGSTYKSNLNRKYIDAINNFGDEHCLGKFDDEDKFFKTHFKVIN